MLLAVFQEALHNQLDMEEKMAVLQEIEEKAMQLPYSERAHLVYDLLSSFEEPENRPVDTYEKEIQRRIAAIKSGSAVGTPVDQVLSIVENKYA